MGAIVRVPNCLLVSVRFLLGIFFNLGLSISIQGFGYGPLFGRGPVFGYSPRFRVIAVPRAVDRGFGVPVWHIVSLHFYIEGFGATEPNWVTGKQFDELFPG